MTSKLDTAGLVERLRQEVEYDHDEPNGPREITYGRMFAEAADLIEALKRERDELLYLQSEVEAGDRILQQRLEAAEARVAELEAALRPFAALSVFFDATGASKIGGADMGLALRRARTALAHKGEGR